MRSISQSLFADPYGSPVLIRRLLIEHAPANWRRYAVSFLLMLIAAAVTALTAILFGDVVNQAYLRKNFSDLVVSLCLLIVVASAIKGMSTYGSAVQMARIANQITADRERSMFDRFLNEGLGFFATRHSAEFVARMTTAASAASQTLNLLITAVGRDVLSLVFLLTVMVVKDPLMSLVTFVIAPAIILLMLKLVRRAHTVIFKKYTSGVATLETLQEAVQGIRIVKAFTLKTRCAPACSTAFPRCRPPPTRWRGSPTARARSWRCWPASRSRSRSCTAAIG